MRNTTIYKNAVVQGDDNIHFEERPEFGIEKKIEEKEEEEVLQPPHIPLVHIENTAILTHTKESLDKLLQVLECAGWRWPREELPTDTARNPELNHEYKPGRCIRLNSRTTEKPNKYLTFGTEELYLREGVKIFPLHKYYHAYLGLYEVDFQKVEKYFRNKEQK